MCYEPAPLGSTENVVDVIPDPDPVEKRVPPLEGVFSRQFHVRRDVAAEESEFRVGGSGESGDALSWNTSPRSGLSRQGARGLYRNDAVTVL